MKLKLLKLLLIINFCFTIEIKAQVYFQNNSKYFDKHAYHPEIPPGTWSTYKILLDSIKTEKRFYSVWKKGYTFSVQHGPYAKSFLMIQDKYTVYKRNLNDTVLRLMYDFSKEKGDTILFDYYPSPISSIIDSVVFKTIGGVLRKVQYITVKDEKKTYTYQLIEGIGCIGNPDRNPGLIPRFNWGLSETIWSCVTICIDNNLVCGSMDCQWDTLVKIKETKKQTSKVYPNPNTGNFTIEVENPSQDISIEVYDLIGNLIKSVESIPNEKSYTLEINMADGMYLVKVTNGGMVWNQRVIIAR